MAQADVYTIKHSPIPCNLVLIGFMGTGKSTVSDYFHAQYNMDVIEMDQIIAQREGMSITDIFNRHGEEYFRDLETALLVEMQSRKGVVLSCGGGVPMRERNVVEMKKIGRVILLTADPQTAGLSWRIIKTSTSCEGSWTAAGPNTKPLRISSFTRMARLLKRLETRF